MIIKAKKFIEKFEKKLIKKPTDEQRIETENNFLQKFL